ncbi:hypothetical protein B0H11DRAFT_2268231 [Mycena galericulata]|nr:hypothetical protein B0H11DRAFT_2268231 [Mycena galericulata]
MLPPGPSTLIPMPLQVQPPPYPPPDWVPDENPARYNEKRSRDIEIEHRRPPRRSPSYESAWSEGPSTATVVKSEPQDHPPFDKDDSEQPSSDLEDCEEVWLEELSDYIFETQKRQNDVERRFEAGILAHHSIVARSMAHRYALIADLCTPEPAASPTPASPSPEPPAVEVEQAPRRAVSPWVSDSDDEELPTGPMLLHAADFTGEGSAHASTNRVYINVEQESEHTGAPFNVPRPPTGAILRMMLWALNRHK